MNSIILAVIGIMVVVVAILLVKKISNKKNEKPLTTPADEQDKQRQEPVQERATTPEESDHVVPPTPDIEVDTEEISKPVVVEDTASEQELAHLQPEAKEQEPVVLDYAEPEARSASEKQEKEVVTTPEPVEPEKAEFTEPTPVVPEKEPTPVAEKEPQEPEQIAEEIPVKSEDVIPLEMEEVVAPSVDVELEAEEEVLPAEAMTKPVAQVTEAPPSPEPEAEEATSGQKVELQPDADEQEPTLLDDVEPKAIDTADKLEKEVTPTLDLAESEEPELLEQEPIVQEPMPPSVEQKEQQQPQQSDEQVTEESAKATPIDTEDIVAQVAVATIKLTLEQYAERLNQQEEQQRDALQQAITTQQDQKRDTLQRELVLMNEKLALLDESYQEELACYDDVLHALEELENSLGNEAVAQAKSDLVAGIPETAESLLADIINTPGKSKGVGAFYSGRLAERRVDLATALQRYKTALEEDNSNPDYLYAAGLTARRLFKYNDAVKWLEQYVAICAQTNQEDPVLLAQAKRELAYTYVISGQHKKAGPMYKEAMTGFAKHLGQESPEMAISWFQIGELQETLGEYDKAVALYKKALAILEKKQGKDHPMLTGLLDKLAALCMELEMEKEAVPLYERLVDIRKKTLRPTHPQLAMSLNNLAESYRLQRQYAEAEACYLQSLSIAEQTQGKDHPSVAAILQELAKLCSNQRKNDEAEKYQARASALFEKAVAAEEKRSKNTSLSLDL